MSKKMNRAARTAAFVATLAAVAAANHLTPVTDMSVRMFYEDVAQGVAKLNPYHGHGDHTAAVNCVTNSMLNAAAEFDADGNPTGYNLGRMLETAEALSESVLGLSPTDRVVDMLIAIAAVRA